MARKSRPRLRRGIYLLPSLLTTGNLFAGYYSVVATLHGEFRAAAIAIGIAMVLDGLDGRIARLTNTQSDFGQAYDSLADVLAFGVAPAVLALSWGLWELGRVGWAVSFLYLVCAAMRLSRFSIQSSTDHRYFVGLPSPAAAGLLASFAFYWPTRLLSIIGPRVFLLVVLGTGLLMVSKIRYRSFKDIELRRPQPAIMIVLVAMAIALVALDPENVLGLVAIGYLASGPVHRVWQRANRRSRSSESSDDPEPRSEHA